MDCIFGEILEPEGFKRGYLYVEDGLILERGYGRPTIDCKYKGYVIPTIFNSHVHIGDAFIKNKVDNLPHDLEKLVAPPNGLKHRFLKSASDKEIIKGMGDSIEYMMSKGTSHFCDFREGGLYGVELLKKTVGRYSNSIESIVLSRPSAMRYSRDEIEVLLEESDGIGLSSISDWDYDTIEKIANTTKHKKKIFAIHASERYRENIDQILDLKPDFLIHMVYATIDDLERVRDNGIPIVVCPRSNLFFNLKPNIDLMRKSDVTILLGTDNVMISNPDVLEEVRWLKEHFKDFTVQKLLDMVTYLPRKIFGLPRPSFEEGSKANLVVLDTKSLKVIFVSLARRSG